MRRIVALLIPLLWGCQSLAGPDRGPYPPAEVSGSGTPIVAPIDSAYVALVPTDTSFWAVKGQALDVLLRFRSAQPGVLGDRLVEFQLGPESLLRSADGGALQPGDSVRITIHPDSALMVFEFEPSGLVFAASSPAILRMWCTHADPDLNGDGTVDSKDQSLWYQMRIWMRELETDPWAPLSTTRSADGEELETSIPGFTGFSVAS